MRITVLILALSLCPLSFAKDIVVKSASKRTIAMKSKKQKVTLASALSLVPVDRPTPMTSDSLTEGAYEGIGTVGNVPGLLSK